MASDQNPTHSVLFICSANQCRSPLAEVIFKQLIDEKGESPNNWLIESAGCWAYGGFPATETANLAANEFDLDLSRHSSRSITESLIERFALVLCMEFQHKRTLQKNFPLVKNRIFLLSEMVDLEREIHDPIGLSLESYLETAGEIRSYLDSGFENIREKSRTKLI